jgi:hypothetical protein
MCERFPRVGAEQPTQRARNRARNAVLDVEDVSKAPLVLAGPQRRVVANVNEARVDQYRIGIVSHTGFDDGIDPELFGNIGEGTGMALHRERRRA